jgi:hypothetical protein
MILGGFGHLFYNYTGNFGKNPAWILGIISVFFIEQAMVVIYPRKSGSVILSRIFGGKLLIVLLLFIAIQVFAPSSERTGLSMVLVIVNSLTGVILSTGILSLYYYRKAFSNYFLWMFIGVLIMLPSAAVHLLDIHPARWFDKNDLNHVILGIGISLFYFSLVRLTRQEYFLTTCLSDKEPGSREIH